jgi:hypothetical protein
MSMSETSDELGSFDMARFVARGVLRFDALVPDDLNRRFMAEVEKGPPQASPAGTPLSECYRDSVVAEILRVPKVAGTIESLVGPGSLFDHQGAHFSPPAAALEKIGLEVLPQHTHQDSTIDVRRAFDLQVFYFPHEVTAEMGGTRYIPGTHLRIVSEMACARYQNVRGQQKVVCPGGTMLFCHHGLWHGGEVNRASTTRFMLKIRLNPTVPQVRLWDTRDLRPEMSRPRVIFGPDYVTPDENDLHKVLCENQPWFEYDTGRLEFVNRIKLWRHLVNDPSFDAHYWVTRLESEPV